MQSTIIRVYTYSASDQCFEFLNGHDLAFNLSRTI